jgi:hypothetical protein
VVERADDVLDLDTAWRGSTLPGLMEVAIYPQVCLRDFCLVAAARDEAVLLLIT